MLNTSISKLVQLDLRNDVAIVFLTVYVVLGCICLGIAAAANGTLEDPTLFVPIGAGVNLILTFLAGFFIWGDAHRLDYPFSYIMIYVLVICGTYLVSSFDLLSSSHTQIAQDHVHVVKRAWNNRIASDCGTLTSLRNGVNWESLQLPEHEPSDPMREVVCKLLHVRQKHADDVHAAREALRKCLKRGLDRGIIGHEAIVELCLTLTQDTGAQGIFRCPGLEQWLESNLQCSLYVGDAEENEELSPAQGSQENATDGFGLGPPAEVLGASSGGSHLTY